MKKNKQENTYFIPLGSNCLSSIVVKWSKLNYIQSSFTNMKQLHGFRNIKSLFNGEFENEVLCDNPKFVKKPHNRGINGESFLFDNYEIVHMDYTNKKDRLREIHNNTLEVLKKQKDDENYYIVVSLEKEDIDLTVDEIITIKKQLDEYINTDRMIIIGSKKLPFTTENKNKYSNMNFVGNFNYRNENFKKVFGNNYIVIHPSNVKELSSKMFHEFCLKNIFNNE